MDFDFFQITGKWNAAKVTRRADKLEEAERAASELERGGASNVEIIGVKAGKREKIRGQRKPAKPAKKKSPAKTRAKKKTPAKRKKTAVKTKGITGEYYITDFTTEKKAKAAAENIRALGFETEIVEPRGQLDLFKTIKKFKIEFSKDEINLLRGALHLGGWSNVQLYLNSDEYPKLLNTLFDAARLPRPKMELKNNEICALCVSIEKRIKNEPNVFLKERYEKLRKQLESFVI